MTIDNLVKVIEAVAKLFAVLVWPAVFVFLAIRFRSGLQTFVANIGEFSLKGAGFEATAKRQAEAAAALGAALASRPDVGDSPAASAANARAAAQVVSAVVTTQLVRSVERTSVLWVDDKPNNNLHERQALEALGINFTLATSTDEALAKIREKQFSLIISDMGRPPDSHAGYTLLDKLRASGIQIPYIIYAGSNAPELQAEARRKGAIGCTNRADELFEMVLNSLRSRTSS